MNDERPPAWASASPRQSAGFRTAIMVALAVAGAAAVTAPGSMTTIGADDGGPVGPSARPTPTNQCVVTQDKRAGPSIVSLGDTVEVTLTVSALCRASRYPVHVVLIVDQSAAMDGMPIRTTLASVRDLVDELDLASYPSTYVSVVAFDDRAYRLTALTNDAGRVRAAINRIEAGDGVPRVDMGFAEAQRVLDAGDRERDPERTTAVAILYSLGPAASDCSRAVRAAHDLRGRGVLSMAVCAGRECNRACMGQIASSQRYLFELGDPALIAVFHQIRDRLINVIPRSLTVTDTLGADVQLVDGSARPLPIATDPARRWLRWHDVYIPRDGVTYTYRVRPERLGEVSTNSHAEAEMIINTGERHWWRFAMPTVFVVQASPTPTPTATPTARPDFGPMTPPARPTDGWRQPLHIPLARRSGSR